MKYRYGPRQIKRFLLSLTLLLENGFVLTDSLAVMKRSRQLPEILLDRFEQGLNEGESIAVAFERLGCSEKEVTQIQFALLHGNLAKTLRTLITQRQQRDKQVALFRKASLYPLFLLSIIGIVLIVLRQYLIPQLLESGLLSKEHFGVRFLLSLPLIAGALLGITAVLVGGILVYGKKISTLKKALLLVKLPFFGPLYREYQTSYFTLEWGNLYKQGLESKEIIQCMLSLNNHTLMYEMASEIQSQFQLGQSFSEIIKRYQFLQPELAVIIYQGELAGKLGDELVLYSQLSLLHFSERLEQVFKVLQPILFLFVAGLVISIYAAMLVPLYQNMGGDLL